MASENYKALGFDELLAERITVLHEVCKQIQKTWGQRDKGMEKNTTFHYQKEAVPTMFKLPRNCTYLIC